jgi:Pectate lyase superfamily protein
MNYRAQLAYTRLIRAGLPAATAATLVPGDITGPRTPLETFLATQPDAMIRAAYTGGTVPALPAPNPYPQYLQAADLTGLLRAADLTGLAVLTDTITVDARDHGATGNAITDDTAALQAALNGLPEGGELLLRPGTYLISAPLTLRRNRTIRGLHAGIWPYDTGGPVRIRAASGFTGAALILMQDEEALYGAVGVAASGLYVGPNDQSGMTLRQVTLDGFNVAGPVDGVLASGLVRSVRLSEVSIRRCTGSAVHTIGYTRTNGTVVYPRGWRLQHVTADSCGNMGYATNLLNDSTFLDCLAVGNTTHGFYLAGPGEVLLIACRAAFNKGRGYYLTGTSYGNVVLSGCSTDRSELSGVYIDTTGRHPVLLSGCALRRDGRNGNGGGGNYAALFVAAATTPIVAAGVTTETGQDDDATGVMSPQFGLRVLNSTSVAVDSGVLFGQQAAYSDAGGNTAVRLSPRVVLMSGSVNSPTIAYSPEPGAFPTPADSGMITWAYDPVIAVNTSSTALTSGVLSLIKLRLDRPATAAAALLTVTAGGVGLVTGQSLIGLYSAAGVLLGSSADQAASWATTGNKSAPLTAAAGQSLTNLPTGTYWLALLSVGTTMPAVTRSTTQSSISAGVAAGAYRFAILGSALTALPASIALSGMAAAANSPWAALA